MGTVPIPCPNDKGLAEAKPLIVLVPMNGIELLTFALRMRCSTN